MTSQALKVARNLEPVLAVWQGPFRHCCSKRIPESRFLFVGYDQACNKKALKDGIALDK